MSSISSGRKFVIGGPIVHHANVEPDQPYAGAEHRPIGWLRLLRLDRATRTLVTASTTRTRTFMLKGTLSF